MRRPPIDDVSSSMAPILKGEPLCQISCKILCQTEIQSFPAVKTESDVRLVKDVIPDISCGSPPANRCEGRSTYAVRRHPAAGPL